MTSPDEPDDRSVADGVRTASYANSGQVAGPCLIIGGDMDNTVSLQRGSRIIIGRPPHAAVALNDKSVSRQHAEIVWDDAGLFIADLGSHNGTWLNGYPISHRYQLVNEDVITVGKRILNFRIPLAAPILPYRDELLKAVAEQREILLGTESLLISDPIMVDIYLKFMLIAAADDTVLLLGETGVGKEIAAAAIHAWSKRRGQAHIRVNCATLTETLLESELFGHVRGAFTDARADRAGAFEQAHQGTLFLDEVGELSLSAQAKLLRVLEKGVVKRVGGTKEIQVDVRVVAATNRDLAQEVLAGRFRNDLWYRINAITITIPPLRHRPSEIVLLGRHFLDRSTDKKRRRSLMLSYEVLEELRKYPWPGNVRQLLNFMTWCSTMVESTIIDPSHFVQFIKGSEKGHGGISDQRAEDVTSLTKKEADFHIERQQLIHVLEECGYNRAEAARRLDIARSHLYTLIKKHGLELPSSPKAPPRGKVAQ